MRWMLTICFLLGTMMVANAQTPIVKDSAVITSRVLPDGVLDTYRQNDDFHYKINEEKGRSLWDRFWSWFWRWIDDAFKNKGVQNGTRFVIYAVAIGLILYTIYKFSGMERRNLFRSAKSSGIVFTESNEDIREMDLPTAIRQAEDDGNYRLALRLQYLNSLRKLSDRNLINYAINKTNHDYAGELTGTPYADSFARVTILYEFGWYGEFEVTREMYDKIRSIFAEHLQLIQS
ncbi:MAG: DUF4129 domain-containing protein [Sphingobacteriales bacterium]|nr:MAG: DUF4129 domain-containing protein [Sphingobacteriales bacterium]